MDLMRFFGGEILEDSIRATAVGPALPLSDMAPGPDEGEHKVGPGSATCLKSKGSMLIADRWRRCPWSGASTGRPQPCSSLRAVQ